MGTPRLLAAALAVTIPLFFVAWIELLGVDQPQSVAPGATFEATVHAVAHGATGPIPTEPPAPDRSAVSPRIGVLAPSDWKVPTAVFRLGDTTVQLAPAPDETWVYDVYYPAPPGYIWRAFLAEAVSMDDGTPLDFSLSVVTSARIGLYQVVYMTWTQPPYWYLDGTGTSGATVTEGSTGSTGPGGSDAPTDILPVPGPSILETTIAVGEVGPPPQVTAWEPPDGAAGVPVESDIRATFDRDMDLASLRAGGLQLFGGPVWFFDGRAEWQTGTALDPGWTMPPIDPAPVPAQVFYDVPTRTAILHPLRPLEPHQVYTAIATTAARATDGVPVENPASATFLTAPGPPLRPFSDVPPDHRFREAIEALYRAGVIGGFPDGTFRPDDPVTRGQLARMLVSLLGLHTPEPGPPPPFTDVGALPGDSLPDYIGEAARAGIALGFDDGTFRPYETVTRIQLVRMIVRAAQPRLNPPPPDFSAGFTDVAQADQGFVNWAFYNDLVDGKAPGRFDPWSTATRGHAARVLWGVSRLPGGTPLPGTTDSGIKGTVLLGPLSPVVREGEPDSRPYAATIVIRNAGGATEVTRVHSGLDGRFSVALPPGAYVLDPVPGGDPLPWAGQQEVIVEPHAFTQVVILYDTGIR